MANMDMEKMTGQHHENLDTLIYIIRVTSFCLGLRLVLYPLSIFIRIKYDGATKLMLLELMATLELCMLNYYIMGDFHLVENFDSVVYIVITLNTMLVWILYWQREDSSPNTTLECMLVNKEIHKIGIFLIFVQIIADYLAYKAILLIWNYKEFKSSINCTPMFHESYVLDAFIFEWMLTIIYRLSIYFVAVIRIYLHKTLLSILVALMLTFSRAAGYITIGSFNNPILGATMRYNCTGIDDHHSLLVYWIATFYGSLSSLFILSLCRKFISYIRSNPTSGIGTYLVLSDILINPELYAQHRETGFLLTPYGL